MADRLRVGVAGLGIVAQTVHLPLLARRWDLFEVTALCDLSPSLRQAVGSRYGVPTDRQHPTLDAMLASASLDAVLVLTSGSHGAAVLQCLDAGVPVLCEKPFAYSVAEADRVLSVSAGVPRVQVAYMKQYDAAFGRLRALLPDPSTIRSLEVEVLHPSGDSQLAFANLLPREDDIDRDAFDALVAQDGSALDVALGDAAAEDVRDLYAGVVLGSLVHDISLVRDLAGSPTSVELVRTWPAGASPGSVEVVGSLASGAALSMRWHYLEHYPAYRETVTVHHELGSLQVAFPSPYLLNAPSELLVVDGCDATERRSVLRPAGEEFENELVALHAMVTTGAAPLSGPAEGRADIVTAQRIIRSYCERSGRALGGEAARS
ncbi:MAG: Gfo/Idh/MocA family protein [Actinomycetes bacterium]